MLNKPKKKLCGTSLLPVVIDGGWHHFSITFPTHTHHTIESDTTVFDPGDSSVKHKKKKTFNEEMMWSPESDRAVLVRSAMDHGMD